MSWIQKLYETYDNCQRDIGVIPDENKVPLLPICHTTQKAHIEIVLDGEGNFIRARPIPKDLARTIIPCTESSGGRTSGKSPHPLCDKLQYVAADYVKYGGDKEPCFRLSNSMYDEKEIESKYFKDESKNTSYCLIQEMLDRNKKLKSHELLNGLIKIPNLVALLNKNETLSNIQQGTVDAVTIIANKYKLIDIFPRTLGKTITYEYLLNKWCSSQFGHIKAKAILEYVKKGNVIKNLVDHKVLIVNDEGKLMRKWDGDKKTKPMIFSLFQNEQWQADAFVRWIVEIPNELQSDVWTDTSLHKSWIGFYFSTKEINALCYVTGVKIPLADQHSAKIRNDNDMAKLISSNDLSGFTFRGRFTTAEQACSLGFEVTQKAHNALRWLVSRQGYKSKEGEQAIVAWATSNNVIPPDPLADPYTLLGFDQIESDTEFPVWTAQELALKLNKKIAGYSTELGNTTSIVVMGLDSATPGRLSITYYRELTASDFLYRINNWHQTCCWIHDYNPPRVITDSKTGKKKEIRIQFVGAPAPRDIALVAYGHYENKKLVVDDKLRKVTVERILPCIIDGRKIPKDLVESVVRQASKRPAEKEKQWEWNKTLSIACALYRKYKKDYEKEDFNMALDENRKTRDYLYGRLLALADNIEQRALKETGENRQTTAARLMQRFADHPYSTWRTIELALSPYKAKLGNYRQKAMDEVMVKFDPVSDFITDKPLNGEFLLGYHCQRAELWKKKEENNNEPEENGNVKE